MIALKIYSMLLLLVILGGLLLGKEQDREVTAVAILLTPILIYVALSVAG